AYTPVTGDVTITARVTSLVNTDANAKAGVMIRNTLDPASANAAVLLTPSTGIHFGRGTTAGGTSRETNTSSVSTPYWVRLVRGGNTFKAYTAPDNSGVAGTFTLVTSSTITITMNSTVLVGLAVTSHNDGTATTATFDNISLSSTADVAPTVATAAAVSANPVTGTTTNLSVLGADSDGGGASNLSYTWSVLRYPNSSPYDVTFSA